MLKRQRIPSPPPCIPFDSNPLPLDVIAHRDAKRRRVLPPVLDGPSRGWNGPQDEESDGEIYYDDEPPQTHNGAADTTETTEYALANSVLHELHALNQHRIMFSGPIKPPLSQLSASYQHTVDPPNPTNPLKYPTPPSGQQHDRNNPNNQGDSPLKDEILSVKAQYEQVNRSATYQSSFSQMLIENRLLGSLFLSRRREREPYELQSAHPTILRSPQEPLNH
ncbi:hypothetical protein BD779DRAFT_1483520 [Infundibulicybe gibba]|nr:hypothetical protein BD779DRAFT_1483520 [Infundibulicybe gibba]